MRHAIKQDPEDTRTILNFDVVMAPLNGSVYDGGWSWNVRKSSAKGVVYDGGSITHTKWGARRQIARAIKKMIRREMYVPTINKGPM